MALLETILDPDEIHMVKILLKIVKMSVRIGKEFGEMLQKILVYHKGIAWVQFYSHYL